LLIYAKVRKEVFFIPIILIHPAGITKDGMLDIESLIRLEKGFCVSEKLLQEGISREEIYFVSSVQDRLKEGYPTQSQMMKKILIDFGVSSEQIIISNQSSSTLDDIRNSFQLIKDYNLPEPIINVSSRYHIPRIRLIWYLFRRRFNHPKVQYVSVGAVNYSGIFLEPIKILRLLYLWCREL